MTTPHTRGIQRLQSFRRRKILSARADLTVERLKQIRLIGLSIAGSRGARTRR